MGRQFLLIKNVGYVCDQREDGSSKVAEAETVLGVGECKGRNNVGKKVTPGS